MSELPRGFVPLPDIEQHTDQVVIAQLGLPIGFDEARLGVNLRTIERISRIASLGELHVQGFDGQTSDLIINPGNLGHGIATAAGTASSRKQDLAEGSAVRGQRRPPAMIKINTSEVQERIRQDKNFPRGPLDAAAQAKYLNKGLQEGLQKAAKDRLLQKQYVPYVLSVYAMWETVETGVLHVPLDQSVSAILVAGTMLNLKARWSENRHNSNHTTLFSCIAGMPLDRFAVSQAVIKSSQLIKSRAS